MYVCISDKNNIYYAYTRLKYISKTKTGSFICYLKFLIENKNYTCLVEFK